MIRWLEHFHSARLSPESPTACIYPKHVWIELLGLKTGWTIAVKMWWRLAHNLSGDWMQVLAFRIFSSNFSYLMRLDQKPPEVWFCSAMLCQTPCPRPGAAAFLRVCFINLPSLHTALSTVGLFSVLSVHSTAPCTARFDLMGAARPQHVHLIVNKTDFWDREECTRLISAFYPQRVGEASVADGSFS